MRECVARLTSVTLEVEWSDRWIWSLHISNCYTVSSVYSYLTETDNSQVHSNNNKFMWLKAVPLKVSTFVWRLFLNRIPTRDKLAQMHVILASDQNCVANCGLNEDRDHLFLNCGFFGGIWQCIEDWLGFSTVFHCSFQSHFHQFGGLRGFSKKSIESMNIIWMSVVWTIWKDRNNRVFQRKEEQLQAICKRVKLQSFWWLKSNYTTFDFDYQLWRRSPLACLLFVF